MWERLQEKQSALALEISKRDKVLRKQQSLIQHLTDALQKQKSYQQQLKKEQKDVDGLDRFSVLNMIRTWTGKQDEVREKELAELATIEAKYREIEKMVTDLEKDIEKNKRELEKTEWESLDVKWELLKREKEQWIFEHNEEEARHLESLYEQKTVFATTTREIIEALHAGNDAEVALERALASLSSAKGYSTWDTFFGGGLIATAVKHSKLNESEDAIHDAQLSLQRFHTELLDLQEIETSALSVERDSFITFADYVFDDIFSAWSIHSKIHQSIDRIEDTLSELTNICSQLRKKQGECNNKSIEIEKEIAHIIGI